MLVRILASVLLSLSVIWTGALRAEFLDLASVPLQTSGSSEMLPNLMFLLDNSGSMTTEYTPDWASSNEQWKRRNPVFNTQYYNPNVNYIPAVTYQGSSMSNQTNFTAVANALTDTGAVSGGTVNLVSSANYFAYVAGEYCTTPNLTSCIIATAATGAHVYPAALRWCNSSTAARTRTLSGSQRCQAVYNGSSSINDSNTYNFQRAPSARYTLTLVRNSGSVTVSSIRINNIEILSQSVSSAVSSSDLAASVRNRICTTSLTNNCRISGNTVTVSGNTLTITTPIGDALNPSASIQVTMSGSGSFTASRLSASSSDVPGSLVFVSINSSVNSYSSPGSSTKHADRTDCAGSTCTYSEEMTNYANWYSYYRTRLLAMKTAASLAFKTLDARYRVGFVTINNSSANYLAISTFNTTQKQSWYQKLFAVTPTGSTPLRTKLADVGRHYAGKKTLGNDDPVQYACQQNFTLMTTDGYWNDSSNPLKVDGTAIGNQDGGTVPRPQFDSSSAENTLADVAKYYNATDIRDSVFNNCTGALGNSVCGTEDDYPIQNMITLTLGLGVSGTLVYSDDYKTQTQGDYADLKTGSKNWDNPITNSQGQRIDDLWHAAVNGGGTYYSATNPKLLRESLAKGLAEIKAVQGAAAAAAASSLAPVTGDNYQYVASYQTVKWIGNLEARTVNTTTLETAEKAVWCVENVAAQTCTSPAVLTQMSRDGSTSVYCKTASSNTTSCEAAGGVLGAIMGTSEPASCYVEIASSCTGTLQTQVANNSRNIYFNLNGSLTSFQSANLPSQHSSALNSGYLALSQMQGLSASDSKITDSNKVSKLVDYLRGNKTYEDISSNAVSANRLFRERQATLGDITQSRPNYFQASNAAYLDSGYKNYQASSSQRLAAVYVGANDGMLHAFDANTGSELWAFIPTPVIPNLANLADKEYGTSYHTHYVNGSPVVADICISGCSGSSPVWRTILVSGLNGGGRGYFALDVTNPALPVLLWEFTKEHQANLGFSFGNPVMTKLQNGTWVVVVSSGYNNGTYSGKKADGSLISNAPAGDGGGYLYVLNAYTGNLMRTLSTGSGSPSAPSGLGKIAGYAENMFENNTATHVYGGDLNGDVWRFDINSGTSTRIARLTDSSGNAQKITTQPELGKIGDNVVVMIGTGKFLEVADLTNTPQNSVYTLKDSGQTSAISRSQLVAQTLTSSRTVTPAKVDFNNSYGWYLDFPAGERVNVDPILVNGVLLMPTLVPNSASCNGAGYGWFNFFNFTNGGGLLPGGLVSEKLSSPAVGYNIIYDSGGTPHVTVTGSNDPTPQQLKTDDAVFSQAGSASGTAIFRQKSNGSYGTKHSWHELIQ